MRHCILSIIAFAVCLVSFSQEKRELKLNKEKNLIDVIYYHDNGVVSQIGSYTLDGKLHGEWLSFNVDGKKQVSATYDDGKKVGKWFYWTKDVLKEVDYDMNKVVSVYEWKDRTEVAINNK